MNPLGYYCWLVCMFQGNKEKHTKNTQKSQELLYRMLPVKLHYKSETIVKYDNDSFDSMI